ncbi:MAG: TonB-dependent receptor [Proteobacteria bacterium]|nr:TonB-dependent receptor [Pseudomonadota bacterium]
MNDSTNSRGGGFDMSNLDPSMIDHIEVIRGAASAIYGAEAMGGVINIVTRSGLDEPGTYVAGAAGAGGQNYLAVNARAATGEGSFRSAAGASKLKDGSDAEGGYLDLSQYTAAARWTIDPSSAINLNVRRSERRSTSLPDDSGGLRLAEIRTLDQKSGSETAVSARGTWGYAPMTLNVSGTFYRHLESIDSPGVAPGVRSDIGVPASNSNTDYRRSNGSANAVIHLGGDNELAVGAEYQREQGGNHTVYTLFGMAIPVDFDLTRNTRSAFAELKWIAARDLTVRAGARYDSIDDNGSQTSPTLGVRYNLPSIDAALRASYSEGFKPPSFFVLGLPVELGGNPNLRAEHSKGGSLGYDQRFWDGKASAGLAVFKTKYTDLVTFDNETNQTVNANEVNIYGAELEGAIRPTARLGIQAHFTRLVSHVVDSDEPLRQRPGRRGGVRVTWMPRDDAQLSWRTEYAAQTFDSSIPTGNLTLPTYLRSDVTCSWLWRKGLSLTLAVDNVFDKENESYVGAVAPGRRFRASIGVEM